MASILGKLWKYFQGALLCLGMRYLEWEDFTSKLTGGTVNPFGPKIIYLFHLDLTRA